MTKEQAITRIIQALVAKGMNGIQISNSVVVCHLDNREFVTITVGPVKQK